MDIVLSNRRDHLLALGPHLYFLFHSAAACKEDDWMNGNTDCPYSSGW